MDNFQEAIGLAETCLRETPQDGPDCVGKLSNLSRALRSRYKSRGNPEDLEQAIKVGEKSFRADSTRFSGFSRKVE